MSRKNFALILGLFLVAGFLFLNVNVTNAYSYTWTGGGDRTTWTDPENWGNFGSGSYPGSTTTDTVIIGAQTAGATGGFSTIRATSTLAGSLFSITLGVAGEGGPTLVLGNGATISASTTVTLVGTSTLKLGDSTWGSGSLKLANGSDNAYPLRFATSSDSTIPTFYSATGTVTFTGSKNVVIATTTYYNLNLTPTSTSAISTFSFGANGFTCTSGGCTATTTISGTLTISGYAKANFNNNAIVLSGSGDAISKANGTFVTNGSLVKYTSASATNIATGTYDNLVISGAATKTLSGNVTATSTVTISSGATLAISTYTFEASGSTWTNSGTVTRGTDGKVVLASVLVASDSAGGAAVSSFGNADEHVSVNIQVTDTSLNSDASTAETLTATVTATSGFTDTETLTLTETGVATGIFRGAVTFSLSGSDVSGQLDYQGGGSLSCSWTDSQDSSDTGSCTGSFTGTAPGGGGGGGSGSSSGSSTTQTTTTTTTTTTATTPTTITTPTTETTTATTGTAATTVSGPTLESVQAKVASAIAKVAALPASPSASELAVVQAEIAAILADLQTLQATATPQGKALGYNFVRPLAFGMSHNDVSNLQTALKTDSSIYPSGKVTGYFGPATLLAVKKFQEKYGIASEGQAGYGNVGPKTRAKLNELFGAK